MLYLQPGSTRTLTHACVRILLDAAAHDGWRAVLLHSDAIRLLGEWLVRRNIPMNYLYSGNFVGSVHWFVSEKWHVGLVQGCTILAHSQVDGYTRMHVHINTLHINTLHIYI